MWKKTRERERERTNCMIKSWDAWNGEVEYALERRKGSTFPYPFPTAEAVIVHACFLKVRDYVRLRRWG